MSPSTLFRPTDPFIPPMINGLMALLIGMMTSPWSLVLAQSQHGEMAGYLFAPAEKVPEEFDGGFSLYAAAWPLLNTYPGHRFQTGLCGTWMHPKFEPGKEPEGKCYTDIEGGLGWWRDTRFPTETPKFIMGGVAPNFSWIANGPGYGKGTWDQPKGLYGVAQLSPWLLFPLDGLNLKQGTCGELFGYGYLPLPLTNPKETTASNKVPTGNQCWTLFLNTANFKGPAAFFTPYFWSHATIEHPEWASQMLDARPAQPNKPIQMETQHVPAILYTAADGKQYARVAPTAFPVGPDGNSIVLHRLTAYKKAALWDHVQRWFEGGEMADGSIRPEASAVHTFRQGGGSSWKIYPPNTPRDDKTPLAWNSFATSFAPDPFTFGYRWNAELTRLSSSPNGSLVVLPEYFQWNRDGTKPLWSVVSSRQVPTELTQFRFDRAKEKPQEPRTTPDDATSCWKSPGPAAGPFRVPIGDGSVVTYFWYRFADQPAMLNADLTAEERELVQKRVEKLHRGWTKDRNYLAPPDLGKLAHIDPALILTPPPGLEIGYVPIATRQELESHPSESKPLQVFILAGQSNMQGHAQVRTFEHIGMDPATQPMLNEMQNADGTPKVCERVWISSLGSADTIKTGKLTAGFGASQNGPKIGPEFTFGIYMEKHTDAPILLIKTAWGGKSLNTDFRPPSAGPYVFNETQLASFKKQGKDIAAIKAAKEKETGVYYRLMIEHVKNVLADIKQVVPDYDPAQGYELAGFAWFQGWNDMVDSGTYPNRDKPGGYDAYTTALTHFIRDVRKDLNAPQLPFVIGVLGVGGPTSAYGPEQQRYKSTHDHFRAAMAAPAQLPEFQGNVATVFAEDYWDLELSAAKAKDEAIKQKVKKLAIEQKMKPVDEKAAFEKLRNESLTERERAVIEKGISNFEFHYLGSAKILGGVGKGLAEAMAEMIQAKK